MKYYNTWIVWFLALFFSTLIQAEAITSQDNNHEVHSLPGFLRLSFDNNIHMPNQIADMGLLGFDYFSDVNSFMYAGFGGYGSVTGTQGGLFTVGVEGGLHHELISNWWGDAGLFVGGGGGKASLTGGGLMLRPHAGIAYSFPWARLGVFYSYIDFPSGEIHSQQVGLNLDLPMNFSYLCPHDSLVGSTVLDLDHIHAYMGRFIGFQRNDFALFVQAYQQRTGAKNAVGSVQDSTMGLVGAELDHYFTDTFFWWLKTSGAFSGIPNGYMDVLGGLGYHISLGSSRLALVPQFGLGAGGGGLVETGGGFLVNPLLGVEWAVTPTLSLRASSGYLWALQGELKAVPITGELIWHLDIATESLHLNQFMGDRFTILGWRFQMLNQTYFHPQRSLNNTTSSIQLIGIQVDQLFTPWFFLSYQAMGAYEGYYAGGYATGMIGPGIQSALLWQHVQLFTELLVGAGGGGGLALSGGSIIEPLVGIRYAFTPSMGVQASVGQMKALRDDLNTPVLNIGFTMRFDTLNRQASGFREK
ncbi:MAG: hypothetical protein Q8R24_10100 [Legionellaceae bacterium]|nr:hypothetical protein [Legionellaceae bacterium]